jgi:NhaP-type Na+/H+ or K+/H+ antiporter
MVGIVSLIIGLLFGFLTSFVFKHCSFLRVNPITETFLLFSSSMVSYYFTSIVDIAGVEMSENISLFACAIVQSHYTYYNMSA